MLFRPSSNTLLRIGLWSFAAIPAALIAGGVMFSHSHFNTGVGQPVHQPVPFSHRHHALELGIDCRYCHTTVETGQFAGMPPTKTCMSCHSMIWTDSPELKPVRDSWRTGTPIAWTRVNQLPKFVYFDHSIHIDRGINCNTCHGPVQQMPMTWRGQEFTMVWCLNCHRHPENYLAKTGNVSVKNQVFDLYWKMQAEKPLSQVEEGWASGRGQILNGDEGEGKRLVRTLGVKKVQLADCNICHR